MSDLFSSGSSAKKKSSSTSYDASDIEVLEGLEPVRRRPGMYIGGTDEAAMHHLVNEILDNSMDEAVAGHANLIEIKLCKDNSVVISDNGRGIPVDPHPKYPKKSALEVILTVLHSGGKFSNKAYQTSGGLHGVGISVVNALSDDMSVEAVRDGTIYRQSFSKGHPASKLETVGKAPKARRGTSVRFHPDPEIFGKQLFSARKIHDLARSKAYLFRGVEIKWSCDPDVLFADSKIPTEASFHFPNGLLDYLNTAVESESVLIPEAFHCQAEFADGIGRVECAITWLAESDGFTKSYCNTVPTPQGGTHESGLRTMLLRGIKNYGDLTSNKKAGQITADDVLGGA
ncbi:MAG TPA: ATP-binding protein, partial [Alphaproteobacteria bacterium]|nr:ATP-binding protein [Alphaproteobacteria bacterium]